MTALSLTACTTPRPRAFDNLHVGMEKDKVLEQVGTPTLTRRTESTDRWIYEFRDHSDNADTREVQFKGGRAVYIGAKKSLSVSAEEQDRINEAHDLHEQKKADEEVARRDHALGVARVKRVRQNNSNDEKEDATDRKLRETLYGIEPDPKNERNVYAPVFEPVH